MVKVNNQQDRRSQRAKSFPGLASSVHSSTTCRSLPTYLTIIGQIMYSSYTLVYTIYMKYTNKNNNNCIYLMYLILEILRFVVVFRRSKSYWPQKKIEIYGLKLIWHLKHFPKRMIIYTKKYITDCPKNVDLKAYWHI